MGGVPREEVPRKGAPREALEEVLGKPWGQCLGELLRKPLRQGVPREVGMWVVRPHVLSSPTPRRWQSLHQHAWQGLTPCN